MMLNYHNVLDTQLQRLNEIVAVVPNANEFMQHIFATLSPGGDAVGKELLYMVGDFQSTFPPSLRGVAWVERLVRFFELRDYWELKGNMLEESFAPLEKPATISDLIKAAKELVAFPEFDKV
jgi:hypothetical protein